MEYNYISTSIGIITYINDDTIFNTYDQLIPSANRYLELITRDVEQANYSAFMSNIDFNSVYFTVVYKDTYSAVNTDFINYFNNLFPNTVYKQFTSAEYTSADYPVNNNQNRSIYYTDSVSHNFLRLNGENLALGYSGSATSTYGEGDVYGTSDINNVDCCLFVFNSNYTDALAFHISGNLHPRYGSSLTARRWAPSSDVKGKVITFFKDAVPDPVVPQPTPDPYEGGGYSGSGGGQGTGGQSGTGGNYDTTSDDMPVPNLPTNIATGTGLFTAYNPDASQLATFANKVWNKDPTTIDDWFRMLFGGDAFNAIIGLSMIPVAPTTGNSKEIYLGNWATGASAPKITNQYAEVNFGSVTLSEFWGNSIDYSPYTRVQLALPYIGIVDVDTDDVIGSVNTLTYHIDVFSGALCAMLHCVKGELSSVIYQWSGNCAVTLPITGATFNAVGAAIMGTVGASAATAVTALTGGSSALLAAGGLAMSGSAANIFGSQKGRVQKSGGFNANSGALGIMTPYFIVTRPVQSIPSTQQITKGYPANISAHLGDLLGYTELSEVHLHDIPGTKEEVLEIENLLKSGVIF